MSQPKSKRVLGKRSITPYEDGVSTPNVTLTSPNKRNCASKGKSNVASEPSRTSFPSKISRQNNKRFIKNGRKPLKTESRSTLGATTTSREYPAYTTSNLPQSLDFTTPRNLLGSLLGPEVSLESFFDEYWEKKPLVVSRDQASSASYYGVRFTREALFKILSDHRVEFEQDINVCRYIESQRENLNGMGRATAGKIKNLFDQKKATLQFHQPQRFQDELWQICELLESHFNSLVGANVYMTPGGSQGLAPHYDDVEVLILQLEGRKHWRLYTPPLELPRDYSGDLNQDDIGQPSHDFVLEMGDLLYFPRGTVHQADTPVNCPYSTHVTISTYQRSSYGDVLMHAMPNILNSAINGCLDYRKGLPVNLLTNSNTLSEGKSFFTHLLRQLSNHIGDHIQQAANQMMCDFASNRLPPFNSDCKDSGGSLGKIPTETCKVRLKSPGHVFVMVMTVEDESGDEDDDEEEEEEKEEEEEEEEEAEEEEEEEEEGEEMKQDPQGDNDGKQSSSFVFVQHSLRNSREQHMMSSNPGEPNGLRFPVAYHQALNQLKESTTWVHSSKLKLPQEDIKNLLMSLWAEGLLEVYK